MQDIIDGRFMILFSESRKCWFRLSLNAHRHHSLDWDKELCRRVAACAALCGLVVFIINNRINLSAVSTPAIKGPAPANQMRAPSSGDSCSADNSAKLLKLPTRPALFTGVGALINRRSWVGWARILRQSNPAPMSTHFPTFGSIQGIHLDDDGKDLYNRKQLKNMFWIW